MLTQFQLKQIARSASVVGMMLIAVGCGQSGDRTATTDVPSPLPDPTVLSAPERASDAAPQDFPNAIVPDTTVPPPLPVPQLISPTVANSRATSIATGRSDPFAPLDFPSVVMTARPDAPAVPAVPSVPAVPVAPEPASAMPPVATLPSLQPAPVQVNTVPIAVAPAVEEPLRLAEAIEVSGVVEVGDTTNVIVNVPGEHTSRPIRVGERLGNGQVLLKRVEIQPGGEPIVVFEQDGEEIQRFVGEPSSTLIGAL